MQKNRIVALIVIVVLGIAGYIGYNLLLGPKNVTLVVSPKDATVFLNDKEITGRNLRLQPGEYTLTAKRELFKEQKYSFTLKDGETKEIPLLLEAYDEEGLAWLEENPDEMKLRQTEGSRLTSIEARKQVDDLPIIKQLPHIDNFYRVDYGQSLKYPDDVTKNAIFVRYYAPQGKTEADTWLKFNGVDLETTEIVYIDPTTE